MSIGDDTSSVTTHVLDRAAWNSLSGPHSHLAEVKGLARRYPTDISPFNAVENFSDPQSWQDLRELLGDAQELILSAKNIEVPDDWEIVESGVGVQLTGEDVHGEHDSELIPLGASDAPEMLDLIARTEPGPFLPRTVELGGYLGIRVNGELVAMAGRRLNPPGWVEISAVCTAEEHRGKGYAARLVKAVAAGIRETRQIPFLHASSENVNAIRLYEKLGFKLRIQPTFALVRPIAKAESDIS